MSDGDTDGTLEFSITCLNSKFIVNGQMTGVASGDNVFELTLTGTYDPATGELAGPDVESQTRQVFRNMKAILEAGGSDLSRVLRCGVFLVDLRDFEKMNRVYAEVFGEHRPARTTVQVASLPDPGLRVEIDAIAYRD